MRKASYERRPVTPAIFNALAMVVASVAVSIALVSIIPATGWSDGAMHQISGFSLLTMLWHVYDHALPLWAIPDDLGAECIPRLLAALIAGCCAGSIGFFGAYAATPLP
jgi:hypothetical protein